MVNSSPRSDGQKVTANDHRGAFPADERLLDLPWTLDAAKRFNTTRRQRLKSRPTRVGQEDSLHTGCDGALHEVEEGVYHRLAKADVGADEEILMSQYAIIDTCEIRRYVVDTHLIVSGVELEE